MKLTIGFTFFALLGLAASVNQTWGISGPYDQLLHREFIYRKSELLRKVKVDYTWPPTYAARSSIITAINVIDQKEEDKGGYASLFGGGINDNFVKIHLKSKRNHGINSIVEIYGRSQ